MSKWLKGLKLRRTEDTGYVGVGTSKTEEDTGITNSDRGMECGLLGLLVWCSIGVDGAYHAQTNDGNDSLEHDDRCSDNVLVSEVRKTESDKDGGEIRWCDEQLCVKFTESHTGENDRQEVGKCIGASRRRTKEKRECPELGSTEVAAETLDYDPAWIEENKPEELRPGPRVHLYITTILLQTLKDKLCLTVGQELVLLGKVDNEEEGENGHEYGNNSFQDLYTVRSILCE